MVDGMTVDEHGPHPDFSRLTSVVSEQSELNDKNSICKREEQQNKLVEDESMEQGRVSLS